MKKFMATVLLFVFLLGIHFPAYAEYEDEDSQCIVEYDKDTDALKIEYGEELPDVSKYPMVTSIEFYNSEIEKNLDFTEWSDVSIIKFSECSVKAEKILWPDNLSQLDIENCSEFSWDALQGIDVEQIALNNVQIEDLRGLSDAERIQGLDFYYSDIGSLDGIGKINGLCELEIIHSMLYDVEDLKNAKELISLNVSQLDNIDLSVIKDIPLWSLIISEFGGPEGSLDFITEMDSLQELVLMNCDMLMTQEIVDFAKSIGSQDYSEALENKKQLEALAEEIIPDGVTDDEIIEIVTQYVVDNLVYDEDVANDDDKLLEYNSDRLYYALKGRGCCAHYTTLTSALLRYAGFEVYETLYVDMHIFNIIRKDGKFYWHDVTYIYVEYTDGYIDSIKDSVSYMDLCDEQDSLSEAGNVWGETIALKNLFTGVYDRKREEKNKRNDIAEANGAQEDTESLTEGEKTVLVVIAAGTVVATTIVMIVAKKKKQSDNINI